jgi:hypothetical protein
MTQSIATYVRRKIYNLLDEFMSCEEPAFTEQHIDFLEKRLFELLTWLIEPQPHYPPIHDAWHVVYSPWTMEQKEIPAFEINDHLCTKVLDTNEDLPADHQEAIATLAAAAPKLFDALTYCSDAYFEACGLSSTVIYARRILADAKPSHLKQGAIL